MVDADRSTSAGCEGHGRAGDGSRAASLLNRSLRYRRPSDYPTDLISMRPCPRAKLARRGRVPACVGDIAGWLDLAREVKPLFGPMVGDPSFSAFLVQNIARGTAFCARAGPESSPLTSAIVLRALHFYERVGFRLIGSKPDGPGGESNFNSRSPRCRGGVQLLSSSHMACHSPSDGTATAEAVRAEPLHSLAIAGGHPLGGSL
jgi:hypothetical protein